MCENDCARSQNPVETLQLQRLYIWIHTAIQQRRKIVVSSQVRQDQSKIKNPVFLGF
ncbi:hypothetical protein NSTC745_03725 [Nostoc sp. DSM 114161]|jgi:hypothetical protein